MKALLLLLLLPLACFGAGKNYQPRVAFTNSLVGVGGDNTNNLLAWWDASKLVGTNDGATLSGTIIRSFAGVNMNATNISGSGTITFETAVYNGLPCFRGPAGHSQTFQASGITNELTTAYIVALSAASDSAANHTVYSQDVNVVQNLLEDSDGQWGYYANAAAGVVESNAPDPRAGLSVIILRYNSLSSADLRGNTGAAVNFNPDDGYDNGGAVGFFKNLAGGGGWEGDICEIRVYAGAHTVSEQNQIGNALETKWGFTYTDQ